MLRSFFYVQKISMKRGFWFYYNYSDRECLRTKYTTLSKSAIDYLEDSCHVKFPVEYLFQAGDPVYLN